ncbi:MAG: GNAT family N-acetyltransferase [Gammaproteobacteria bacterium]|nr:GNAT family N-acetyltransferase [Gammaproteobacteria bacterium]
MWATKFLPINLNNDFPTCVEFLCDAFVCSYGNADEFETMAGADIYRAWLEDLVSTFPEGAVHVWHRDRIVGQIEMRLRDDLRIGVVNLVYLIPEERGGQLGIALQSYVTDVLRQQNVNKARLSVSPSNGRAMAYYTKHGWHDLGPRPDRPYVNTMEFDVDVIEAGNG